jgi:tRNA threonylcarbamoyladenosine biosynthesis protein TsaB
LVLVLVVDTSTPAVTAALVRVYPAGDGSRADPRTGEGVELLAERATVDARAHGELLGPGIHRVLTDVGARPADLAAIVAGLGPGPFTGLRVGLVTAASMGQALSIPTYGVCSLDGIGALSTDLTLVATDARRREVYWAVYDKGIRVSEPAVNRPADLRALLDGLADERDVMVRAAAGDGARMYADVLGLPVAERPLYPSPLALAETAVDRVRAGAGGETLHPLYLRRPDAVEPGAPKLVRQ